MDSDDLDEGDILALHSMARFFEDLDTWLSNGGFKPNDWNKN